MEPVCNLLGDQGAVAACAIVDDEVDLGLVLHNIVHDFRRVLDHFCIQHSRDHFVKREGFDTGFLGAHPSLLSPWQTVSVAPAARPTSSLRNYVPDFTRLTLDFLVGLVI